MGTTQFRRGSITDKILSVLFSVVLAVSLAPSAAYAQESGESTTATQEQPADNDQQQAEADSQQGAASAEDVVEDGESSADSDSGDNIAPSAAMYEDASSNDNVLKKAEKSNHVYLAADGSWVVEVKTASTDMPEDAYGSNPSLVGVEKVGDDERSAISRELSKSYDSQSFDFDAVRLSIGGLSSMPDDAEVSVWALGRSSNRQWSGYAFSDGKLSAAGEFGSYYLTGDNAYAFAGASLDGAFVVLDATDLKGYSAEKSSHIYLSGDASWMVEVKTASTLMPKDAMTGEADAASVSVVAVDENEKAEIANQLSERYEAESFSFDAVRLSIEGLDDLPGDSEVSVWELGRTGNKQWAGFLYSDGTLSDKTGQFELNQIAQANSYAFSNASLDSAFVVLDSTDLKEHSSEKSNHVYLAADGSWVVEVKTASTDMPEDAYGSNPSLVGVEKVGDDERSAISRELSKSYDSQSFDFDAVRLSIGGLSSMPDDAEVSVWALGRSSNRQWSGYAFSDGKLSAAGEFGSYYLTGDNAYAFAGASLDGAFVVLDATDLKGYSALEAGTYTITANPYIKGTNNIVIPGLQVFLASPAFPPTVPASNNATLVVDEDGRYFLKIKLDNASSSIFTQQSITSGDDVKVLDFHRDEQVYQSADGTKSVEGRIDYLEVELLNKSGEYSFGECSQWPTPLGIYTDMQVDLSVDFSSAKRQFAPGEETDLFTKAFVDEKTGVVVTVRSTSAQVAYDLGNGATLASSVVNEGNDYEQVQDYVSSAYTSPSSFKMYEVGLRNSSGEEVSLQGNTEVEVELPTDAEATADVYSFDGSFESKSVNQAPKDGKVSISCSQLGTFLVISKDVSSRWYETNFQDSSSGIVWTWRFNDQYYKNKTEEQGPRKYLGQVDGFSTVDLQDESTIDAFSSAIRNYDKSANAVIRAFSAYSHSPIGNAAMTIGSRGDAEEILSIPVSDDNSKHAYLVTADKDGSVKKVEALKTAESDGIMKVTLLSDELNEDEYTERAVALFSARYPEYAYWGNYAYIVLASDKSNSVDLPTANDALVYSGKSQIGFQGFSDAYTLSGTVSATDAGDYEATASLKNGYVWSDGTTEDKTIKWSIAPAELTATYTGETITEGNRPAGSVAVTGFVNGENETTAKDYVAPTVKYPSSLSEGEYTLTPEGGSAANYTFKNVSGVLKVEKSRENEQLQPGEYTVTSNLYVPGELNTQLPGVTAYLTNPNNPLGIVPEGVSSVEATAPTTPVSNNAKLVVDEDGSLTLTLKVVNPVFTLQKIGNCQNAAIIDSKRDGKTYSDMAGSVSRQGRIIELTIKLSDNAGSYVFNDCVEFPTLLGVDWKVPLTLDVDFSGVPGYTPAPADKVNTAKLAAAIANAQNAVNDARVSADGSDVDALDTWVTQGAVDALKAAIQLAQQALASDSQEAVDAAATALNAATMAFSQSAKNGTKVSNGGGNSGNNGGNNGNNQGNNGSGNGNVAVTEDGHYAAGTYTVSGNVWFDKSATGLPLNPHISNGAFPPKDPVSSNAKMVVDSSGHARVYIPVVIQDKVMTVNSVWGSGVSYSGGNVVIDLGTPRAGQTSFNGTCTANITMGALASTISGKSGSYTWAANWAVNFGSASMASGGGTIPASALAVLAGVEGTVDEASAEEAALAALEEAAGEDGGDSTTGSNAKKRNGGNIAEEAAFNALPIVIGALALLAIAGAITAVVLKRRKRNNE